ncbi:MAG: B-cell lymphoma 3 protein, partial [Heterodermia speciosa]
RGHQDIVQMLLNAKNIDVNVSTDRNRTALHYAANMGHQDIVQMLLNAKTIDVNVSTNRTWTALHYAANMGHQDIVQMLLNAINIDVNVMKNDKSWTPLHCAAKHDHKNIAQMLLNAKDIDVNPKTDTGSTPLHIAARLGHVNIVKILLDNNADTNAENESHRTALTEAIRACEEDTAILLIRRGSPFMSAGKHSPPPLHVACKYSCPRVVKALIKKAKSSGQLQAMLEAGYEGFWPLHLAVSQDSLEITSQLIEAGADVNLRDKNQKTPLIRAATNGNIPVMDYLLARNAFRYTKDRTGQDYLQILKRKHPDKYDTQISQLFRS